MVTRMYEVRAVRLNNTGNNVIGIASFVVDGKFAFNGIRVIESANAERGFFLAMPSYKTGDDKYIDYFHPISSDMAQGLADAVERALGDDVTIRVGDEPTKISLNMTLVDDANSKIKAKVTMRLGGDFICENIALREGSNGLFVSYPSYQAKDGKYKNYCNPITKEYNQEIESTLLGEYKLMNVAKENKEGPKATEPQVDYSVEETEPAKVK